MNSASPSSPSTSGSWARVYACQPSAVTVAPRASPLSSSTPISGPTARSSISRPVPPSAGGSSGSRITLAAYAGGGRGGPVQPVGDLCDRLLRQVRCFSTGRVRRRRRPGSDRQPPPGRRRACGLEGARGHQRAVGRLHGDDRAGDDVRYGLALLCRAGDARLAKRAHGAAADLLAVHEEPHLLAGEGRDVLDLDLQLAIGPVDLVDGLAGRVGEGGAAAERCGCDGAL